MMNLRAAGRSVSRARFLSNKSSPSSPLVIPVELVSDTL